MSIESNQELQCFYFTQSRDWLRKPASNFQSIKCKIKANRNLVIRVFPRLKPVLFQVPIGFCDCFGLGFTTLNRNVQHLRAAFNGPFGSMCIVQSRVTFLWERCCVLSWKFYGVTYTSSGLKSKIVKNQTSLSFSMLPVIHLIVIVIVQPWYSFLKNFTFPLLLKLSFQSSLSCAFEFHSFSFLQLSCNLLAKKRSCTF